MLRQTQSFGLDKSVYSTENIMAHSIFEHDYNADSRGPFLTALAERVGAEEAEKKSAKGDRACLFMEKDELLVPHNKPIRAYTSFKRFSALRKRAAPDIIDAGGGGHGKSTQ